MSTATDALLFYGFCSEEDGAPCDILSDDECVAAALAPHGLVLAPGEPWWDTDDDIDGNGWRAALDALCSARGLELHEHCSDGDPMVCITHDKCLRIAQRGCPCAVDPRRLRVSTTLARRFATLARELGIRQRPQWWLASVWG